jgi:alpha-1,3-rhamnosyl/mannosyltransferase
LLKVILSADSIQYPLTGIGRYAFELARSLKLQPGLDLFLQRGGQLIREPPADKLSVLNAKPGANAGLRKRLRNNRFAQLLYRDLASFRQASTLKMHEDAVFHGPNFLLPHFAGRSVVTIHDLSLYTWAHYHPKARVTVMQREIAKALKRASLLITDSEFTRLEVAEYFNWPLERIVSVPLACSDEFHPRTALECHQVLKNYALSWGEFSFYSGTIEPRKNIDGLLDAYALLPLTLRRRWPLILCGYQGWKSDATHARIKQAEQEGWLKYLGYVPAEHLPVLFASARLFLFPSWYEGFGLPVLESMASGVPVICSTSSSLPEVVGGAALTCDPDDSEMLSHLIMRGLQDDEWRSAARYLGLEQAATFSWQRCAQQTAQVYRMALGVSV